MEGNVNAARRSADYTARTVGEAVERAAADLGIPASQLDYTVIKDSTHTILGLVRTGEATIRVWIEPSAPPAPPAPEVVTTAPVQDLSQPAPAEEPADVVAAPGLVSEAEEEEAAEEEEEVEGQAFAEEEDEEALPEEEEEEEEYEDEEYVPVRRGAAGEASELEQIACDVVTRLLDGMGLYAAVEVVQRGGQVDPETKETLPLQINIVGDDLGVLIGRRGETLRDLQFLTRLIVSRQVGRWPDVVVDVEGYKAHRADALVALAQRMADRVRSTGQPVTLEPMPAYERRIVHLALRDDKDVYTESTGEGDARKVQILPR